MRKKKENELYNDSWLYILLLTTLVILLESLKTYKFNVYGTSLTYSIFLLPLIYFIVNYIAKKYDYKKAIAAITISGTLLVLFVIIMSFALGERFILSSITGEFCAYIGSQLVNLTIYMFLLNNTKSPYLLVLLTYIFSLIVYYMFYTLIYLNLIILDNFWMGYFITLGIQFIICIPIAFIDKKVKRGKDIIK